ncbi:MAG: cytochrome ubiquinol oxidase subunit I [Nitrososphaerota archaeon]
MNSLGTGLRGILDLSALGIYIHSITVAIVIGFSITLTIIEFLGLKKKDSAFISLAKQISIVIVVAFVFGAATGTLVEFGLVQVWNGVILAIGSFFFTPLFLELVAFTIEATLLIALLYTWDKFKNPWTHWIITVTYTGGALLSGALITSVNSWMQAPWGTGEIINKIYPWAPIYGPLLVNADFLLSVKEALVTRWASSGAPLVNPTILNMLTNSYGELLKDPWVSLTSPYALTSIIHQLLATTIVGVFWIAGALAYNGLRMKEKRGYYLKLFKTVALIGSILLIIQGIEGHEQGLMVYLYQPTKFAMIAGLEKSGPYLPAGLTIFGDPNYVFKGFDYFMQVSENHPTPNLRIGGMPVKEIAVMDTLKAFEKLPLVKTLYEVKISLAALSLIISLIIISSFVFRKFWHGRERILFYGGLAMFFIAPALAGLGWAVREIGRKPWTVYGLLYPEELVTPNPIGLEIVLTIIGGLLLGLIITFTTIYLVLKKPPKFLKIGEG